MQNRRFSPKLFVLFMIGVTLSFGALIPTASAQQIEMKYLNSFLSQPYEKLFDASPYVGAIACDSGDWVIQFFERIDDEWSLHHVKRVEMVANKGLESCTASDSLLVLVLDLPNNSIGYQVIDISSDSDNYDVIEIPAREKETNGEIEYVQPYIYRIRLKGRTVCSLTSDRRMFITRYNNDFSRNFHKEIMLSSAIGIRDFDLIDEDEIIFVGIPTNRASDPNLAKFQGVGFARILEDGGLEYDDRRWFYQAAQNPVNPFEYSPNTVDVCGSTVFVSRQINNINLPGNVIDYEVLIVDWSDRENPKTDRLILDRDVPWDYIPRFRFNKNRMAISVNGYTSLNVFLFKYDGLQWNQMSAFENKYLPPVLNDSEVIFDYQHKLYAYDITDPQSPFSIDPPIDNTSIVSSIAFAGQYAYLLLQDFENSGGDCSEWMVLDVSDPGDVQILKREPLDVPMSDIDASDSVLVLTNSFDGTCKMYSLNGDGSIGEEIPVPDYPPKDTINRIRTPFWNSHLIAFSYLQYKNNMEPVYSNTEEIVRVYQWNGSEIGDLLSTLTLPLSLSLNHSWIGDCLIVNAYKELEIDPLIQDNRINVLMIYSYQDPEYPTLIAEYPLPLVDYSKMWCAPGICSYNKNNKVLAYKNSMQSGLIDFADPANPRHLDFFLPVPRDFYWIGDRLVFHTDSDLIFYRLNESYELEEIGRKSDLPAMPAFNPIFTQDRIYANRFDLGVEIYSLTEANTFIQNWKRF